MASVDGLLSHCNSLYHLLARAKETHEWQHCLCGKGLHVDTAVNLVSLQDPTQRRMRDEALMPGDTSVLKPAGSIAPTPSSGFFIMPVTRVRAANDVRDGTRVVFGSINSQFGPEDATRCATVFAELAQNMIDHSGAGRGYIAAVLHAPQRVLNISVSDLGVGISRSLKALQAVYRHYWSDSFAVSLALRERISRHKEKGRGKGLAGVYCIVKEVNGSLWVRSGRGLFVHAQQEYEAVQLDDSYPGVQASVVINLNSISSVERLD